MRDPRREDGPATKVHFNLGRQAHWAADEALMLCFPFTPEDLPSPAVIEVHLEPARAEGGRLNWKVQRTRTVPGG